MTYAYSHSSYPEFYDLWTTHLFGHEASSDATIIVETIIRAIDRHVDIIKPVIVIDLGTGTGRVIKDVLRVLPQPRAPLTLVGVDHSAAMLARACSTTFALRDTMQEIAAKVNIQWIHASATTYADALLESSSNEGEPQNAVADVIIFSAGSIAHLTAPGERQAFLQQTATLLAPGGVALVSVLTDFFVPIGGSIPERASELDEGVALKSAEMPGTTFVKEPTVEEWDAAREVKTEKFSVQLVRDVDGGELWKETVGWSLRTLREKEWLDDVEGVGLLIKDRHNLGMQILYALQLSAVS